MTLHAAKTTRLVILRDAGARTLAIWDGEFWADGRYQRCTGRVLT
jgi:hypothetical protein